MISLKDPEEAEKELLDAIHEMQYPLMPTQGIPLLTQLTNKEPSRLGTSLQNNMTLANFGRS